MRSAGAIHSLIVIVVVAILANLSGCAWVNAAGRVYEGIGDGLTTASAETKPGFSKTLFGVGGKVGKALGSILVDASGNDSTNNSVSLGVQERQQVVRRVQTILNRKGYDAGPNDGQMGTRTATAIRQYQADHGSPVSGNITKELVEKLGIND